jgi:transposase-like protein
LAGPLWQPDKGEGEFLDLLVQRRRDKRAAAKLMRKLLKKQGFAPKVTGAAGASLFSSPVESNIFAL